MAFRILDEQPKPKQQQEESLAGTLGRGALRSVARGVESIAGLPGDIASTLVGLGGGIIGQDVTGLQKVLPTSENIKKYGTESLTGEYLGPQGSGEEFLDRIIGDAATFLIPGGLLGKGAGTVLKTGIKGLASKEGAKFASSQLAKALGKSGAANLAGLATEEITGSPLLGQGAKLLGFTLANTVGGRRDITNMMKNAYAERDALLQNTKGFPSGALKKSVGATIKHYAKGASPDKDFVTKVLAPVETAIGKTGHVKPSDLIQLKQDLRQQLLQSNVTSKAYKDVQDVLQDINKAIANAGEGKKWYSFHKEADSLYNALEGSNRIQDFISSHPTLNNTLKNPVAKSLLYYGGHGLAYKGLSHGPSIAAVGAAALGGRELFKVFRLLGHPAARKYYKEAIQAGLAKNVTAMTHALAKLDKEANRFEKFDNQPPIGSFRIID